MIKKYLTKDMSFLKTWEFYTIYLEEKKKKKCRTIKIKDCL